MKIKTIIVVGQSSGVFLWRSSLLSVSPSWQRVRSGCGGRRIGHWVVGGRGRRIVRSGRRGRVRGGGYVGRLLRLGYRCGGR